MILAMLSDIHSNPWALRASILASRKKYGNEVRFCFLGDIIGYGPYPLQCLRQIKDLETEGRLYFDSRHRLALVAGNHEYAWLHFENQEGLPAELDRIAGIDSPDDRVAGIIALSQILYRKQDERVKLRQPQVQALVSNMVALRMDHDNELVHWYREKIMGTQFRRLEVEVSDLDRNIWTILLAHGSLGDPLEGKLREVPSDRYGIETAMHSCQRICNRQAIIVLGHTHVPMWFSDDPIAAHDITYNEPMPLSTNISLLNPGSVGLPRDHDLRPGFIVLDLRPGEVFVEFVRVPLNCENNYEIERAQLIETLRVEKYPQNIVTYFQTAKYSENGALDQESIEHLEILKRRAGENWIPNEEQF